MDAGDTVSKSSSQGASSTVASEKKKTKKSAGGDEVQKELKREKTLRKVLKDELKKKNDRVAELEAEMETKNARLAELEKEVKEKETKFMDLYMENSLQHDKILELNNLLSSEREAYANALNLHASSSGSLLDSNGLPEQTSKKSKKHLKTAQSMSFNPVSGTPLGSDDSEMIMGYEKRLQEQMMQIQKMERDLLYKDEEIKSIKKIASEVASQLEPAKRQEDDFRRLLKEREEHIIQLSLEKEGMGREIESLVTQLHDESRQSNKMTDMRLDFEGRLDRKDTEIHRLREDVVRQRDEIKGKDEAIKALSLTLLEKGSQN